MKRSLTKKTVLCFLCAVFIASGQAAEFFVAAEGLAEGDGSRASPWTLAVALAQPPAVKPGDTLWIQQGVYAGGFSSQLRGTQAAPITVRGRGGRVRIDCKPRDAKDSGVFEVKGEWAIFRDLEFTCSDLKRTTELTGSWPDDIRRGNISAQGSNLSFVNLIIHDLSVGIGLWGKEDSGAGGEIYGCVIYHNGWNAPDRGHGHGIYAQNAVGTKRIVDNVIFNQFGYGLHAYGSEKAFLRGFHIEGNAIFNNGCLKEPNSRSSDLAVGGSCPTDDIAIVNNHTYGGGGIRIGYSAGVLNRGLTLRGNTFGGAARFTAVGQATYRDNRLIAPGTLLSWDEPDTKSKREIDWDGNSYLRTKTEFGAFNLSTDGKSLSKSFADWQKFLGADTHSTYAEAAAKGQQVVIRPNRYEPGRAHIIVYNWDRAPEVPVDLSQVLKSGQLFRIVSAQNFFGEPIVSGVFKGKPIPLPMQPTPTVQPIGMADYDLPVTGPEFGVFVVLPGA